MRIVCSRRVVDPVDGEFSQEAGRRSEIRIQTVLRVGRVIAEGDEGLVRVRNLSNQGARLQLQIPVEIGDLLTLELSDDAMMSGRVVWSTEGNCGLVFDKEIDCADLLGRLASQSKSGACRAVRLPISLPAVIRSEQGLRRTVVEDISQRGMKLRHDDRFVEGLRVSVTLPSGLERCGVVRWTKNDVAGVMLLDPFSPQELGSAKKL
ncbi:MAG: PilZ domain-containing protein [Erythrobacter sp.]|nr:MAG: PilZ domain-containing protein [Erythrobacter sp.]